MEQGIYELPPNYLENNLVIFKVFFPWPVRDITTARQWNKALWIVADYLKNLSSGLISFSLKVNAVECCSSSLETRLCHTRGEPFTLVGIFIGCNTICSMSNCS